MKSSLDPAFTILSRRQATDLPTDSFVCPERPHRLMYSGRVVRFPCCFPYRAIPPSRNLLVHACDGRHLLFREEKDLEHEVFPSIGAAGQSCLPHEDEARQEDSFHGNDGSEKRKGTGSKCGIGGISNVFAESRTRTGRCERPRIRDCRRWRRLNLPAVPLTIFAPKTPAHAWLSYLYVLAHDSEPALVYPGT